MFHSFVIAVFVSRLSLLKHFTEALFSARQCSIASYEHEPKHGRE